MRSLFSLLLLLGARAIFEINQHTYTFAQLYQEVYCKDNYNWLNGLACLLTLLYAKSANEASFW